MALRLMVGQGQERRVEESSAGKIMVGEDHLAEEMIGLDSAVASASGPLCIDVNSLFGSDS